MARDEMNRFIEAPVLLEFNNMVRELGDFKIDQRDPNVLDIVKTHCEEYRKLCSEYGILPSWEGIALALGITRQKCTQWLNGTTQWAKDAGVTEYLQKEWSWINNILVTSMQQGRIDKITGIFLAKNNFLYTNEDPKENKTQVNVHLSMAELVEGAKNLVLTGGTQTLIDAQNSGDFRLESNRLMDKSPEHKTRKKPRKQAPNNE